MALSCSPRLLLIADEPTTALDVTTQAQILDLMRELQREDGMAIMLITHDLGVVAEMADDVVVMYLGRVVEQAPVDEIFHDPRIPTRGRCCGRSRASEPRDPRTADPIAGSVPHPIRPAGCPFHPRCPSFMPGTCDRQAGPLVGRRPPSGELLPLRPFRGRRGADVTRPAAARSRRPQEVLSDSQRVPEKGRRPCSGGG